MVMEPVPEGERRPLSVRVHVRTENPSSRIQVFDSDGSPFFRQPPTGLARVTLNRDRTYIISHWVGSGERLNWKWTAEQEDPDHVFLPDVTHFVSANPLPGSDLQDSEALEFAGQRFRTQPDKDSSSLRPIYLSARIRHPGAEFPSRGDLLESLQTVNIGWFDGQEFRARAPRPMGQQIRQWENAFLQYDIEPTNGPGAPLLAISPPWRGSDWIYRQVPMFDGQLPRIFLCEAVNHHRATKLLDWRRARYSLYLGADSAEEYRPTNEDRYE